MARPKQIEDIILLDLIEQYFLHKCNGNPAKLKKIEITEYIQAHGYPKYAVTTLRRNKTACDYLESLKENGTDKKVAILSTYKTLDVENFILTNKGSASLTKALTELDCYYKTIADSAVEAIKAYNSLITQNDKLQNELFELKNENCNLNKRILELMDGNKAIKADNETLKNVINDYVYPDICNELLCEDKELRNVDTIIENRKLKRKLIDFKITVDVNHDNLHKEVVPSGSSIIKSLSNVFEEDDV